MKLTCPNCYRAVHVFVTGKTSNASGNSVKLRVHHLSNDSPFCAAVKNTRTAGKPKKKVSK